MYMVGLYSLRFTPPPNLKTSNLRHTNLPNPKSFPAKYHHDNTFMIYITPLKRIAEEGQPTPDNIGTIAY